MVFYSANGDFSRINRHGCIDDGHLVPSLILSDDGSLKMRHNGSTVWAYRALTPITNCPLTDDWSNICDGWNQLNVPSLMAGLFLSSNRKFNFSVLEYSFDFRMSNRYVHIQVVCLDAEKGTQSTTHLPICAPIIYSSILSIVCILLLLANREGASRQVVVFFDIVGTTDGAVGTTVGTVNISELKNER